ncbi:hypothetical protein TUBRATIS_22840 [Tubulinosema ratisbonensis]|uniref:Ricin B lectin domain-containing protein n=1 Tax=Tubulinosema ratisbonensis TaxID=291195 RepID=A0A437AJC2_9MICR|nr:hypothetical protein TUBRATIS_22840 [Tubulinosema ratisbonensis]
MLFLKIIVAQITFPHAERNTSIYELNDPAVLLVNKEHPSKPVTLFDYVNLSQVHLPVGLHELHEEILKYQLWHVYYENNARKFYLELEYDKNVTTEVEGNLLQARKGKSQPEMRARTLDSGKYFEIVHDEMCLTVDPAKSEVRDSYPLRFKPCTKSENQSFAFVSKMQAVCKLGNELCPKDEDDLFAAEAVVLKRLSQFIS